jgi:uncharacterized protein YbjT (DUF2867 family)
MKNVLILGAGGQIAKHAIDLLLKETDVSLTLFLRKANKLSKIHSDRVRIVEGDVLDGKKLKKVMMDQDVVYANLSGAMDKHAKSIVEAMDADRVKRLIFVTSVGIYDEVPGAFGAWNKRMIGEYLVSYRKAADIIEATDLDYTLLRPAWLTDYDEIDYEITQKGESFKGTEVSRKSVAALIVQLIQTPGLESRKSLGVNKPNTDGDKPAFY